MSIQEKVDDYKKMLALFPNAQEKYQYLIEQAKNSEDFPEPEGPTKATSSPSFTFRFKLSKSTIEPLVCSKLFFKFFVSKIILFIPQSSKCIHF